MLRLVAIDMDGTLVDVSSSFAVVHDHFGDHNEEGLRLFNEGRIDDYEFIRRDVAVWRRHKPHFTLVEMGRILDTAPLMPGAATLLGALRGAHVTTAIVSGGIDLLAHRVARELGIDIVLANGFEVDAGGHLTGEGIIRVPVKQKESVVRRLQEDLGIPPEETASIGNSEIDVGMFRRSAVGIAFHPEDEAVRRGATAIVEGKDLGAIVPLLVPPVSPADPHRARGGL